MSEPIYRQYEVYKGLQKPLIFKAFKGKFIYWCFGAVLGSVVSCIVVSMLTSFIFGGLALVGVSFGGLTLIAYKQKQGLYNKDKKETVYIINRLFSND